MIRPGLEVGIWSICGQMSKKKKNSKPIFPKKIQKQWSVNKSTGQTNNSQVHAGQSRDNRTNRGHKGHAQKIQLGRKS